MYYGAVLLTPTILESEDISSRCGKGVHNIVIYGHLCACTCTCTCACICVHAHVHVLGLFCLHHINLIN